VIGVYAAVGFGTSSVNGNYTYIGIFESRPVFSSGLWRIFYNPYFNAYCLDSYLHNNATVSPYTSNGPIDGTWRSDIYTGAVGTVTLITEGVSSQSSSGEAGLCVFFDGVHNYARMGMSLLTGLSQATVECRFRSSRTGSKQALISDLGLSNGVPCGTEIGLTTDGKPYFRTAAKAPISSGSGMLGIGMQRLGGLLKDAPTAVDRTITGNSSVANGAWHHIAGVISVTPGDTATWDSWLYVDGALVASDSTALAATNYTIRGAQPFLARSQVGAGAPNLARIALDEVRWSSSKRYAEPFTPDSRHTLDADTVAYYRFNTAATQVRDEAQRYLMIMAGSPLPVWLREDVVESTSSSSSSKTGAFTSSSSTKASVTSSRSTAVGVSSSSTSEMRSDSSQSIADASSSSTTSTESYGVAPSFRFSIITASEPADDGDPDDSVPWGIVTHAGVYGDGINGETQSASGAIMSGEMISGWHGWFRVYANAPHEYDQFLVKMSFSIPERVVAGRPVRLIFSHSAAYEYDRWDLIPHSFSARGTNASLSFKMGGGWASGALGLFFPEDTDYRGAIYCKGPRISDPEGDPTAVWSPCGIVSVSGSIEGWGVSAGAKGDSRSRSVEVYMQCKTSTSGYYGLGLKRLRLR